MTETVAQARMLDVTMAELFDAQGWGAYTSGAFARGAGMVIIAVNVACLVLAIGFSVPRIRDRRPAWWIPLVCAVVWLALTILFVLAAVVVDPAFAAAWSRTA